MSNGKPTTDLKVFTAQEVSQHNKEDDCWLVIDNKVYDVTKYLNDHPGGPEILYDLAGADATNDFEETGHSNKAREIMADYLLGTLKDGDVAGKQAKQTTSSASNGGSLLTYVLPLVAIGAAIALKVFWH